MLRQQDIRDVAQALKELPEQIATCERMAQVLVETGQPWTRLFRHTDHDRAKEAVAASCKYALQLLQAIRHETSSAEAIRACASLMHVQKLCRQCLHTNDDSIRSGNGFSCLVTRNIPERAGDSVFTFRVDSNGQIIERS